MTIYSPSQMTGFVTGAAGLLGTALTARLLADVFELCGFYNSAPGNQFLKEYCSIYTGDITNQEAISDARNSFNLNRIE